MPKKHFSTVNYDMLPSNKKHNEHPMESLRYLFARAEINSTLFIKRTHDKWAFPADKACRNSFGIRPAFSRSEIPAFKTKFIWRQNALKSHQTHSQMGVSTRIFLYTGTNNLDYKRHSIRAFLRTIQRLHQFHTSYMRSMDINGR